MTPSNDNKPVPPVTAAFRIPGLVKKHRAKQPDKTISQ
jgi:hypothetical protein